MNFPEENSSFFCDGVCTNVSENIPENDPNYSNDIMLYPTLDYINQILLEEDMNHQFTRHDQEVAALSNIEKSFYDALEEKDQPSEVDQSALGQSQFNNSSITYALKDQIDVSVTTSEGSMQDSEIESLLAKNFQRGIEEGNKFLPSISNLAINSHANGLSLNPTKLGEDNTYRARDDRKGRKKNNTDLNFSEGPNRKISAFYSDETARDGLFDKILLDQGEECTKEEISHVQEKMKCKTNEYQEFVIDLESLLIECAGAVARNNHRTAEDLIREIRKQASPVGNGAQRLSCVLTDGLEARLAGTGSETYRKLIRRRISTKEILKAYHMYITACPILRVSYGVANEHICKAAESASKIHIIDLGIAFGFQWPPLIQALARRKSRPLKLRITGVDVPQAGFRPDERIKQTGLRLEEYAKSFGVPFEYRCIASLWESIRIEDLKIDDDEVLIVNSMFTLKQLGDETLALDCPRNRILDLIRNIKPNVFVLGIFDVFFSPFFTMRFKKVLSHYSKLFDMFDKLVPRGDNRRRLMESELVAPSIINLVACEGSDWVVRPETREHWQRRISRAGFEQLPMDPNIVKSYNEKVKIGYNEGFFVEENCGWLLQGWRGTVDRALSLWKPINKD